MNTKSVRDLTLAADTSGVASLEELATRRGFEPPIRSLAPDPRDTDNRSLLFVQADGSDQTIQSLAERDGCGCPPWIVRCAHFNGSWLVVHPCYMREELFAVCKGTGAVWTGISYYHEDDEEVAAWVPEADALAAFYAAEEALLRGGEA